MTNISKTFPDGIKGEASWTTFTPSFTNFTPTTATNLGRYRVTGRTLEVYINVTCSTTLPTGIFLLDIPGGFTIDSSMLIRTDSTFVFDGVVQAMDLTPGDARYGGLITYASSTSVVIVALNGGNTFNANVPFTWASTDSLSIFMKIPIT